MTGRRSSPQSSPQSSPRSSSRSRGARGKNSFRRRAVWLSVAALLSALIFVVIAAVVVSYRKRPGVGRAVDVELTANASDAEVVAKLQAAGVIDDARFFALLLKFTGGARAKAGRHFLADDLSPAEVIRRLRRSPSATHVRVTIPEGFNRYDIARRLREKRVCDDVAFIEATSDPELLHELSLSGSAEGWLFPATYELPIDGEPRDVVRRMVSEARARIDQLMRAHESSAAALQSSIGFGEREVVILASVVEKEAAVDDERPLIASVFLNRIREPTATGGKLQADPTAMYGCLVMSPPDAPCVAWLATGGKPSAEIQHDASNRYSTYTHAGLPPGAICNPGERSLQAVLAPSTTRYFYFVARGGGRHTFSETLGEHNHAIKP